MIIESPVDLVFRDLFYRLRSFAGLHDVFLKLEGFNVTGSIKIKTALGLLEDLEMDLADVLPRQEHVVDRAAPGREHVMGHDVRLARLFVLQDHFLPAPARPTMSSE